jgi:large subunit ribosomal protein L15
MKYNELTITRQTKPRRSGRGISAGRGKTAGRGTKGQGARKSPTRHGFEGGQMPLHMRLPKLRGFKSHRRVAEQVYTGQIDGFKKASIDTAALFEAGLISNTHTAVKLIYKGEINTKKEVKLQTASKNAIAAIEKAGGSFKKTPQLGRPVTSAKKSAKAKE